MKIRSITYFCNPKYPLDEKILRKAGTFLAGARSAYEAAGYEVQTVRLATIPFPTLLGKKNITDLPKLAEELGKVIQEAGVAYASLGPALPETPRSYEVIPEAIAAAQNVFYGGIMADTKRGLDLAAVRACAGIIVKCAPIDPNGFANLQFAALANVKAGSPFFPAAYHDSDEPAFAIATESANLAVQAFENTKTLEDGRNALISEIAKHGQALSRVAQSLTQSLISTSHLPITNPQSPTFLGIDFSLAPFPSLERSLGTAFERLGVSTVGLHGSLAAAAILTESIDRADFPRAGFSGLMLPVLEDATLAKRAAEGTLSIKDLLLYSAVCGTGLDTIPLPGDTTSEQIAPLLLDLCALALRLDKPLTARLMPVPNKKAGEETNFDFTFFAPSKIMTLEGTPLKGSLSGNENLLLQAKRQ